MEGDGLQLHNPGRADRCEDVALKERMDPFPTKAFGEVRSFRRAGIHPRRPRRTTSPAGLLRRSDRSETVTVKERIDPFPTKAFGKVGSFRRAGIHPRRPRRTTSRAGPLRRSDRFETVTVEERIDPFPTKLFGKVRPTRAYEKIHRKAVDPSACQKTAVIANQPAGWCGDPPKFRETDIS